MAVTEHGDLTAMSMASLLSTAVFLAFQAAALIILARFESGPAFAFMGMAGAS